MNLGFIRSSFNCTYTYEYYYSSRIQSCILHPLIVTPLHKLQLHRISVKLAGIKLHTQKKLKYILHTDITNSCSNSLRILKLCRITFLKPHHNAVTLWKKIKQLFKFNHFYSALFIKFTRFSLRLGNVACS